MSTNAHDVVIIGAGSVGVPAAWSMARSGLDVLVVDRMPSPGQGSNKSAIGGIRATHSEPAKIRTCLRSLEIASTWQATYGDDIEWMTGGYSFVAYREQEQATLKSLLASQKASGLSIDWRDAVSLRSRIPDLNPRGLLGGTFAPGDGHCSPLLLGHALYRQALAAGAQFRFNETVQSVDVTGHTIRGVTTNKASYAAPIVVNAAGGWAADVGRTIGIEHPVRPDSHEAGITEPVQRFLEPMIVDISPAPGSSNYYFFQLATGQVVFCLTPSPLIPGTDRRETSAFLPLVSRRMVHLMPRLANLRVRRAWRGLYPMTPDGSPLVGTMDEPRGYVVAIGMCGQGFMLGPGLGETIDRLVRDDLTAEDTRILESFSPNRTFAGEATLK